jgi:hypothetical protein
MVGVVGPKQSQPFQDRNRHEHVVINTREVMPSMAPSLLKIQRRNSGDAHSNRDIMCAASKRRQQNQALLVLTLLRVQHMSNKQG